MGLSPDKTDEASCVKAMRRNDVAQAALRADWKKTGCRSLDQALVRKRTHAPAQGFEPRKADPEKGGKTAEIVCLVDMSGRDQDPIGADSDPGGALFGGGEDPGGHEIAYAVEFGTGGDATPDIGMACGL